MSIPSDPRQWRIGLVGYGEACPVPAFTAEGQPAWQTPAVGPVELPVYHHWSFRTRAGVDFATLAATIPGDLSPRQREEMVAFFVRELQTPTWMRALSDRDLDASYSVRPDHQWTGAYPAWPPGAAQAIRSRANMGRTPIFRKCSAGCSRR